MGGGWQEGKNGSKGIGQEGWVITEALSTGLNKSALRDKCECVCGGGIGANT